MRLSLATRIFLGYAVVLVTFGAVSIYSVAEMHWNQLEIRLVSEGYLQLSQSAAAMETMHQNRGKDTEHLGELPEQTSAETRRAFIVLAENSYKGRMEPLLLAGARKARQVQEFAPDSEAAFVQEIGQMFDDLRRSYAEYEEATDRLFLVYRAEKLNKAAADQQMRSLMQLQNRIGVNIQALHKKLIDRITDRVTLAERRERRSGVAIIGLSVLAIGVGLLATAISARTLRPVRTLIEGVSRIGRGDYSAQLGLRGDDEISVLAREFDHMASSLKEREAQLKEKQEALLRAEQLAAAGRISAQIAHEVRNPLSSIGLNVEMLQEQLTHASFPSEHEAQEARELLASVIREVDRLTEVTEEYLKLARHPPPALAPEDVNQIIASVLDFSREELQRSGVTVHRELDPTQPKALADEGQLRQVLLNLVRNSREAMGTGGVLTVRSRVVNGAVELALQDTGRGMPPEVRERVFEPFFSTKEGGTGLGLAVSRQIVQAHGGAIDCESAPGQGTTFVVRLPRA